MRADVIVGGFYGDEGKGKYVGSVCHDYDAVLRVNASTNAGHCVSDGRTVHVTRQLPSVFFPDETLLVVAPGALLNPLALVEEVRGRPDLARIRGKVKVASSVSLVIRPYVEKGQGGISAFIGSTHQGTGPSAVARAAKHSLRLYDLRAAARGGEDARLVLEKVERTTLETLPLGFTPETPALREYARDVLSELASAYEALSELLGDFCVDYSAFLLGDLHRRGRVLVEGCNGLLLDNLHGGLPHVTSAPTNIGGLICGANLSNASVDRVIVVIGAYANCLGKRPFPTELTPERAAHFHENCNEVDVAQHRTRRLGWIDLPGLRKALTGARGAQLHMNKLDVLSGLETIKICTHYEIGGEALEVMPDDPWRHRRSKPRYVEVEGWPEDIREVRAFEALPPRARAYVRLIDDSLPCEVASLGVGPRNEDMIFLPDDRVPPPR